MINKIYNNKCIKLICGAGNENIKEIESLAYIYASAGINMIDVCSKKEVLDAAKRGIKLACKEKDVAICVSVGIQEDVHVQKAVINRQKCVFCKKCTGICLQNAIFIEDDKVMVDEKKCIGCAMCVNACPNNAIVKESKYKAPYSMLLPLLSEEIDCVEFHCSTSDIKLITDCMNKIKSIYKGPVGICIDRSKLSDDKIAELIKIIKPEGEKLMFQADGNPMSGCDNEYGTTLQTVAFAQMINNKNLPVYLILSGGTNIKTPILAKQCRVNYDGIAIGSYARKAVKEYISRDDFFENESVKNQALGIAKKTVNEIKNNME